MKIFHRLFILSVICLLAFNINAEMTSGSSSVLLEKSGLNAHIDSLPKGFKMGIQEAVAKGLPIKGEQLQLVLEAIDEAYAPDKVRGLLSSRMDGKFSAAEQLSIFKFLDTPLGQRIVAAEKDMAKEETIQKVMENGPQLVNQANKNTVRLGLLQSLIDATGSTEFAVDLAMNASLAADIAFINASKEIAMPPMEQLLQIHQQNRYMMTPVIAQMNLAGSMHMYQGFSDAELNQYLEFALSPAGKKYFFGISEEFNETLKQCGKDLGKIVAGAASSPV